MQADRSLPANLIDCTITGNVIHGNYEPARLESFPTTYGNVNYGCLRKYLETPCRSENLIKFNLFGSYSPPLAA